MRHTCLALSVMFCALIVFGAGPARAETATARLAKATTEGGGASVGTVTFTDTGDGLEIKTELRGLPPGVHGFHIHENGLCAPMEHEGKMTPAQGAGGHYDPDKTGRHLGPDGGGHRGDLPRLTVNEQGRADLTLKVKNLSAGEIKNRAVIIHAGGDNYSDSPETLGGGGARLACGVIE